MGYTGQNIECNPTESGKFATMLFIHTVLALLSWLYTLTVTGELYYGDSSNSKVLITIEIYALKMWCKSTID